MKKNGEPLKKSGRLHGIVGPMCSGKTRYMDNIARTLIPAKEEFLVCKPSEDTRSLEMKNRDGLVLEARPFSNPHEIIEGYYEGLTAVFVDEMQLLPEVQEETMLSVMYSLLDKGVDVYFTALNSDFRGEVYPFIARLMALSDYAHTLQAVCVICHAKDASRTQRLTNGEPSSYFEQVKYVAEDKSTRVEGGVEQVVDYEPRCRGCHVVPGRPW